MFKKRSAPSNIRKRKADPDPEGAPANSASSDITSTPVSTSTSTSTTVIHRKVIKKQSALSATSKEKTTSDHNVTFASSETASSSTPTDMGATRSLDEWDKEDLKKLVTGNQPSSTTDAEYPDEQQGLYKGQAAYKKYIKKREEKPINSKMSVGPIRAPSNLRVTCRFDYQPDVCKDYKETGYCGYGDNCKFMHDRSDYKSGWQLDLEWEEQQKQKALNAERFLIRSDDEDHSGEDNDDEELPFACLICRDEFKNPVMTKCQHYFCEKCALEHFRQCPNCAYCNQPTQGNFVVAKNIIEKMKQRKEKKLETEKVETKSESDSDDSSDEES